MLCAFLENPSKEEASPCDASRYTCCWKYLWNYPLQILVLPFANTFPSASLWTTTHLCVVKGVYILLLGNEMIFLFLFLWHIITNASLAQPLSVKHVGSRLKRIPNTFNNTLSISSKNNHRNLLFFFLFLLLLPLTTMVLRSFLSINKYTTF